MKQKRRNADENEKLYAKEWKRESLKRLFLKSDLFVIIVSIIATSITAALIAWIWGF